MKLYSYNSTFLISAHNDIDGEAFLELTDGEVKSLLPGKLGTAKKILRLKAKVNWFTICVPSYSLCIGCS